MNHEANLHSIQALEKQIEEGKGDIIELKRTRNSLLNISTHVPPEILARIFVWTLFRKVLVFRYLLDSLSHFDGLRKGSYNFLLVCHHWFEVASRTPELWSFWGNTLQDWKKRHHRSRATPADLVLYEPQRRHRSWHHSAPIDGPLLDAIRSRVTQDIIRQAHLSSCDHNTLASIVSSLTPDDEGRRNENIESIVWRNRSLTPVDISHFFARSRLEKLYLLELTGKFHISSWDRLASCTTLLTALSLDISESPPSPAPTASQLVSILTSSPNLRELRLSGAALPNDTDGSAFQAQLRNLKILSVEGVLRRLFDLLHRLILPQALDEIHLTVYDPTVEDISQTLAPYMHDYFRRDVRFQDTLVVSSCSSHGSISIVVCVLSAPVTAPTLSSPVSFTVGVENILPNEVEQFLINLITPIPREPVICFAADLDTKLPEELLLMMPNISTLNIYDIELTKGFLQPDPDGPNPEAKLLPSLRWLSLGNITLDDDNWGHLTTYLAHQTSDDQLISLTVFDDVPHIPPEVADEIKGLVGEFIDDPDPGVEDK